MSENTWCKNNSWSVGGVILALFILSWGIIWLGNDIGWWQLQFPFWPVVVIIIGLGILLSELRKIVR